MRLDYYRMTEPPVDIVSNRRGLYISAKHREICGHLPQGIRGFEEDSGV